MDSILARIYQFQPKGSCSASTGLYGNACPECGQKSEVLETRYASSSLGVPRRTRYCQECQLKFVTYEIRSDDLDQLISLLRKIEFLTNKLDEVDAVNRILKPFTE